MNNSLKNNEPEEIHASDIVKRSLPPNLSLSLTDGHRADIIITLPPHHRKLFKYLEVTDTQV